MKCSECECLVRVKNKLGYNLYYCGYKKYGVLKALCRLYINNEEYRKDNETCKYYKAEKKGRKEMTDEEKAEEILQTKGSMTFCAKGCGYTEKVKELIAIGLAEGRKKSVFYKEHLVFYEKLCEERAKELEELEKENAELKAQNKTILEDNDTLNKWVDELKAQIEKMKCCGNCKNRGLEKYISYPCCECKIWHRELKEDKWEWEKE